MRGSLATIIGLSASVCLADAPGTAASNFFNVVAPVGADPWVIRHTNRRYYATMTTGGDIRVWTSMSLTGIFAAEPTVVWTPPANGPYSKNIWAPELHCLNGKWYVYFAADDGNNAHHRMYVLENGSADPLRGAFEFKGMISDPAQDRWAIDGTVLRSDGQLYFVWSGWEGDENIRQILYIARMRNPWTLAGPRVEISRPEHPWETAGGPPAVNEGPQALVGADAIHIVYSAGASWTDHYCLGLLTAPSGADPLDPASWRKHPRPVFASENAVFGPGHCALVTSPNGREPWIVYHAARWQGAGWTRSLRAQPFSWDADGTPRFGSPAPTNQPIPLPGGEPARRRFEAEHGVLAGVARTVEHPSASGGVKVGYLDTPGSYVEITMRAAKSDDFILAVRFGNGTAHGRAASHRVWINGAELPAIRYPNSGWDNWAVAFVDVRLRRGENTIRFEHHDGFAEIDCIDLIRSP